MNENLIPVEETKVLGDGSAIMTLNFSKEQGKIFYEAALLDNTITLQDLEYQRSALKTNSFRKLVIAAFVLQALKNILPENQDA